MNEAYYRQHAQRFYDDTVNVDMAALYQPFIGCLPPGARILDAGCGSGRDVKAFSKMGFAVDAFDASPELVALARRLTGKPVEQMRFDEINAAARYDGIWCCASLLHVPEAGLPDVMAKLAKALKPGGVWYLSFKYGSGEREKEGRRFTDMDEAGLRRIVDKLNGSFKQNSVTGESGNRLAANIEIKKTWQTGDLRSGRSDERWLNAIISNNPN
ncbi:class I SAM-dependent methyltransferase [Kalamiella sp. sgz302252]|uniref:class I SAM-dependent methyltransferase n=1 Tax=Pantoea sp. sgz302252 TaxID=3341827 RepID=UPI0036D3749C